MTGALVSCIVPVFNGERYLREALDSILAQTYRPLEVVVADDGSTDSTAEIVSGYADAVRYVRQDNAGAPAARNLGLDNGRGDFIAFLDADDVWHPEKLARQMARFDTRPDLDLCVTNLQAFWIAELTEEAARFRGHPLSRPLPGYSTVSLLARRALFDRVGRFNVALSVGDPMEWFLRAAHEGAVMELMPETLVYRRMHQRNLSWDVDETRRMTAAMQASVLRVVKESLDRRRREGSAVRAYDIPGPR